MAWICLETMQLGYNDKADKCLSEMRTCPFLSNVTALNNFTAVTDAFCTSILLDIDEGHCKHVFYCIFS